MHDFLFRLVEDGEDAGTFIITADTTIEKLYDILQNFVQNDGAEYAEAILSAYKEFPRTREE